MEKRFKRKVYKTLIIYNLLFIIVAVAFYYGVPIFLNYPPESINTEFETMIDMGWNYYVQYILAATVAILVSNIVFLYEISKIRNWTVYANSQLREDKEKLVNIKRKCLKIPIKLYIIHAIVPPLGTIVGLLVTGASISLTLKISICLLAIFITLGLLIYLLSKRLFGEGLKEINNLELYDAKINLNTYKVRIFFQFLPLILLMGTYAYLVVNSVAMEEKGELIFKNYTTQINQQNFKDGMTQEELISKLSSIKKESNRDTCFIMTKDKVIYQDTNEEISDFFIKYTFYVDNNNHTYGYYASDLQGTYKFIQIEGEKYAVGIMYGAFLNTGYIYISVILTSIIIIAIIFLIFFARDFTNPIIQISDYMEKLANEEAIDYDKKIPVTSNDELGDLTVNFNKILDLEKKHVETIKEKQDTLIEKERLSSLGQLIGGIAHNLKTPIMSISGNLQAVQDLILEYETSVGDEEVTVDDHKEIANDMKEQIKKMKVYLSYMSDIITAVKGQAVQLDSSTSQSFTAGEVASRVEILMKHELKNALIEMPIVIDEDVKDVYIKGDINSLVQVLNNLVQNAIYASKTKNSKLINFNVTKKDNRVCFKIQDYGCGISDNVREKIFKEMITTKGKNGTGLGLYMSYSTIKGKFNGGFDFESEIGEGTSFYITIPITE